MSQDNTEMLVKALTNIAQQKTLGELIAEGEDCEGDFVGAYDAIIEVARHAVAALALQSTAGDGNAKLILACREAIMRACVGRERYTVNELLAQFDATVSAITPREEPSKTKLPASPDAGGGSISTPPLDGRIAEIAPTLPGERPMMPTGAVYSLKPGWLADDLKVAEKRAVSFRNPPPAAPSDEEMREFIALQIKLAMQDEMCDGPGENCRFRTTTANKYSANIMHELARRMVKPCAPSPVQAHD